MFLKGDSEMPQAYCMRTGTKNSQTSHMALSKKWHFAVHNMEVDLSVKGCRNVCHYLHARRLIQLIYL